MSSFIERLSIAGSAAVLGLMAVLGVYGLASLLTLDPDDSSTPGSEEFLIMEGRGIPIGTQLVRPQVSPAATSGEPGEPTPAEPASLETVAPGDEALSEFEPLAFSEALSVASVDDTAAPAGAISPPAPAPTAVANTPAPVPGTAPLSTPEPSRPTPTAEPTPAPEPTLPPLPTPDLPLPIP
jgi:hypothetical protein